MAGQSSQFTGNIPENYDEGLGPYIFQEFAEDLARRASYEGAEEVLEMAAGTGIVSRRLRDALPPDTRLVVSDLNQAMLTVAAEKFDSHENIEFRSADAMELPFDDGSFDLVVCQFGVMFFPDKQASFREVMRVLRPGGAYQFNIWGTMEANPFSQVGYDAGAHFFPDDPPGFYKVPFGFADTEAMLADMSAAGLTEIEHEVVSFAKEVDDWEVFAHGMVFGNPLIDEINERGGVEADDVVARILEALRGQFGEAPGTMPLQATVYQGTRP